MQYLLGIDVGTTSLKLGVYDTEGRRIRSAVRDYTLQVSGDEIEFPAEEYLRLFDDAYEEVSQGIAIAAMAVDTQCETMVLTDESGRPLMNAIVWLDNRAAKQADEIRARFGDRRVYEVTGQPQITATWPAAKLLWVRENRPELFGRIRKVFLLEDWLLYHLTGRFVTEPTMQSSTIYYDIQKDCWWQEMLDFVGIRREWLPQIEKSAVKVGEYRGAAVVTGAIDQIAGAIGAGVADGSTVSEMTGTTMAIFVPSAEVPAYDPDSIVPCHKSYDGRFCLLAWTPTAGIALKWFRSNFCENFSFRELDELAKDVPPGSDGLVFLPYLCGSAMPKYDPAARGAFLGLTMEHTRGHAVRSILEAVACMLRGMLEYLGSDCREIRAMGGGAASPLWCQIKADMTGRRIVTLRESETACLGSAILAGVGAGILSDVESACGQIVKIKEEYVPSGADYTDCYQRYCEAEEKML